MFSCLALKLIVTQMLARAAEKGLPTTSLRVGQVSGSADTGAWNTNEWVPIMVKTSLALRMLPTTPGVRYLP